MIDHHPRMMVSIQATLIFSKFRIGPLIYTSLMLRSVPITRNRPRWGKGRTQFARRDGALQHAIELKAKLRGKISDAALGGAS